MKKTTKYMLICGGVLGLIFYILIPPAANGYGYMGYNGYHRGPSFFYWGGPSTYYDRNARSGSVSGPSVRGGGPGSGK